MFIFPPSRKLVNKLKNKFIINMLIRKTQVFCWATILWLHTIFHSFPDDSCQKDRDIMLACSVLVEDHKLKLSQDVSKILVSNCSISSCQESANFNSLIQSLLEPAGFSFILEFQDCGIGK